jgi:hypothetical protein
VKYYLLTILHVLLLALTLQAQDKPDSSSTVEFRVTRFDPLDGRSPEFRTGRGDTSTRFEVPLTFIAGPFKATLRDGVFLDLWRGDGEKPKISVRINPAERKDLLLVFVPRKDRFAILKIRTSRGRIKGGDRLIVNATRTELAIRLGNKKAIHIPSGKSQVIKAPSGSKIVSLPVLVSRKVGDSWKLASSENWPFDPRFRKILFAYMGPKSRHLTFHAVREATASEKKKSRNE